MRGVVTGRDVIINLRTIWVEFGPRVTFSCVASLFRRRHTTFLDLALKNFALSSSRSAKLPRA